MYTFLHLDAAETAFANRQLELVRAQTYDIKLGPLKGRLLVPVDNTIPAAIKTVTYYQYTSVGMAIIIADYSRDLPRVSTFKKEFSVKPRDIGDAYGYNIREIQEAQFAGVPLDQKEAASARRAFDEKVDSIIKIGDSEYNLLGFLNQPNANLYTLAQNAALTSTKWINKTPDEILLDMNGIVNDMRVVTKEAEAPDTMVLPLDQYTLVTTKPRSSQSDTTIAQFFLANNEYIKQIVSWEPCKGAGSGGVDRMVIYRRDPLAIQLLMPEEFRQLAPEQRGLEILVNCIGRCAGVVLYYPMSMSYADDI